MADSTPLVPKPLIEWLEKGWRNDITKLSLFSLEETQREIGRQQIIQSLRTAYNQQNKTGETA
jgi:hypothetical protein